GTRRKHSLKTAIPQRSNHERSTRKLWRIGSDCRTRWPAYGRPGWTACPDSRHKIRFSRRPYRRNSRIREAVSSIDDRRRLGRRQEEGGGLHPKGALNALFPGLGAGLLVGWANRR